MAAKRKKQDSGSLMSLFLQLLTWSTLVWMLLLSITLSITLNLSLTDLQGKIENNLSATAASLANSEMVRQALAEGECPPSLIEYLDTLVVSTEDLDIITIADADSIRLYHVVHSRIGQEFVGGDQVRALEGAVYLSDGVGTMGLQRRAFCPVLQENGQVCGFVMASATMGRINDLRSAIIRSYLRLALLMTLLALALAGLLTLLVQQLLHGYDPAYLVHTYFTQTELLNDLDEGVVSTDDQGRVQLVNRAAEHMLGQRAELLEGQRMDDLIRGEDGASLLSGKGENTPTSRPNILCSCMPLEKKGKRTGATLILKDKSEAMRQAEQLNGTRHIVSALRANTHEFMNKLQVISGLLQMGRQKDALDYIGNISAHQAKSIGPVLQHIRNANVAALLLGKLNNMRELDIELTLLANSDLPEHSQYLSTADLVTVVGNLTENAIEAVNAKSLGGPRSIVLQITEDETGLLIMVSDTGTGIAPEDVDHIYTPGFSTKAPEGRGIGMSLVRNIVQSRHGTIEMDSEPGSGTNFTLIFHQKR